MAPPRKHETDVILDAARDLVLRGGPRAAGVAAIAEASGAPVGTLYHRFGNRDGILSAIWLRIVYLICAMLPVNPSKVVFALTGLLSENLIAWPQKVGSRSRGCPNPSP